MLYIIHTMSYKNSGTLLTWNGSNTLYIQQHNRFDKLNIVKILCIMFSLSFSDNHDSLPSGNPYYTHDQPTMFQRTPIGESDTSYTKQRKGRTFDEIREYNRRQQTQPNYSQQAQWMEVQQQRQQKERKENHNSGSEPRLQGNTCIYHFIIIFTAVFLSIFLFTWCRTYSSSQ